MSLGKFISFPVLFVSLIVGFFLVYVSGSEVKNINVYPTPENVDKFLWKDGAGTCYEWDIKEVKKPSDDKDIHSIPVQN